MWYPIILRSVNSKIYCVFMRYVRVMKFNNIGPEIMVLVDIQTLPQIVGPTSSCFSFQLRDKSPHRHCNFQQ